MKIYKENPLFRTSFYLICLLLLLASCSKDDVAEGIPVITGVSLVDEAKFDSTFTKASRGTVIVIRGNNINDITAVYFNDLAADFNPVYNTSDNLIIRIPENAPTIGTNPNVSNEIRVITKRGEAKYSFVLELPPPTISYISNENAKPGDSIYIHGSSFFGVEKIVFPGDIESTEFSANEDGTILGTIVPNNMNSRGPVSVYTAFGFTSTFVSINNINGPEIFNNFDDVNYYNGSGGYSVAVSNSSVNFPGNHGNYGVFDAVGIAAGNQSWDAAGRSVNLAKKVLISPDSLGVSASKYAIKFEIFVKVPWESGVMRVVHSTLSGKPTHTALYKPWSTSPSKTYQTTGWVTVTIPLTDFKLSSGVGDSAKTVSDLIDITGTNAFNLRFYAESGIPVARIHMAVDNMRLVRIVE